MKRGTANMLVTLRNAAVSSRLDVLLDRCDVLALQEWPRHRDALTSRRRGWDFRRPALGGGPIGIRTALGEEILTVRAKRLTGPGYMGRVPGRKTILPTSWATRIKSRRPDGTIVVRYNIHLTAGIQTGLRGYRTDLAAVRRVKRHQRERTKLQTLVNRDLDKGHDVEVYGDTNFHRMPIIGLNAWWDGCASSQVHTLGERAIDGIYTSDPIHPGPPTFYPPLVKGEHRHLIATGGAR